MSPRIKKSSQSLRGKVALITGAGQGIGLAIARALAAEGCNLVISSRNKTALAKACRELKAKNAHVLPRLCDVRDPVSVRALMAAVQSRFHRIDILINNAGIARANLRVGELPLESGVRVRSTSRQGARP